MPIDRLIDCLVLPLAIGLFKLVKDNTIVYCHLTKYKDLTQLSNNHPPPPPPPPPPAPSNLAPPRDQRISSAKTTFCLLTCQNEKRKAAASISLMGEENKNKKTNVGGVPILIY